MGTMSRSPFGEPLPIYLDRLRPELDGLDAATRLEAISAAIPVYESMRRLHDRIRDHAGLALITVHGWLREGNFVFVFEIDRKKMAIVGLVIEAPSPDDPDGALAGIMYLNGRPRLFPVGVPKRATSPAAHLVESVPASATVEGGPMHDTDAGDAARKPSPRPVPTGVAQSTRAGLVRSLADVLTMARVGLGILAAPVRTPSPTAASIPVAPGAPLAVMAVLATVLAHTRRDLLRVRSAMGTATIRAAERLSRRAAARRRVGEPVAFTLDDLLGGAAAGSARSEIVVGAKSACALARDGAQVRWLIGRLRSDLEDALCRSAVGGFWERGAEGAVSADALTTAPGQAASQAFEWPAPAPVDVLGRDDEPVDAFWSAGEPLVLTANASAMSPGRRPAFFALDERDEGKGGDETAGGR